MKTPNKDLPAHPFNPNRPWSDEAATGFLGLTKREYFAGLAMQGWIACQHEGFTGEPESIAERSLNCADALLKVIEDNQTKQ